MRTIHAVLAIPQALYRDLMELLLSREYDVHLVGHAHDEVAIMVALHRLLGEDGFCADDPVVVVTSIQETKEIPASVTRLLVEFPEVIVVGIYWATAHLRTFQLRIDVQEIPSSVKGLVEAIRECTRHQLPW